MEFAQLSWRDLLRPFHTWIIAMATEQTMLLMKTELSSFLSYDYLIK